MSVHVLRPASSVRYEWWRVTLFVVVLVVSALILLALAGPSREGGPLPAFTAGGTAMRSSDPMFETSLALLTRTRIEPDNRVRILLDGDSTFTALWRDLRAARHTIAIQTFSASSGVVLDTLAAILTERVRAGVAVRVLLDAQGARMTTAAWRDRLRANGVAVVMLKPLTWRTLYRAGNRVHVRVVAIDDSIAYTGGLGLADVWLGDGRTNGHWRETNVRVEGPAAAQLCALFAAYWFEATRELLPVSASHHERPARDSGVRAGVFASGGGVNTTAEFVTLAVTGAERRLYIANSYFVPTPEIRVLLINAVQRGVDVRVITSGQSTDVPLSRYGGRYTFGELLRGGVRIYEYEPTMMHAKTFIVDTVWASIGSMNLDNRSMSLNDEANVAIFDSRVVAQLDSVFAEDLRFAHELTVTEFEHRGLVTRVAEWFAMILGSNMF